MAGSSAHRAGSAGSSVIAMRTVPSASAITRKVFESNSILPRRKSVITASTRTPCVLLWNSALTASMLLRAFAAIGLRSIDAFSVSAFST